MASRDGWCGTAATSEALKHRQTRTALEPQLTLASLEHAQFSVVGPTQRGRLKRDCKET